MIHFRSGRPRGARDLHGQSSYIFGGLKPVIGHPQRTRVRDGPKWEATQCGRAPISIRFVSLREFRRVREPSNTRRSTNSGNYGNHHFRRALPWSKYTHFGRFATDSTSVPAQHACDHKLYLGSTNGPPVWATSSPTGHFLSSYAPQLSSYPH
jgi:hypothetical protein